MSEELKRFEEFVDWFWELVFGTVRRPEVKFKGMMTKENTFAKPKRARTKKGRYKGDDLSTKDFNEAWVGGKSPRKKTKRKTKGKK